MIVGVAIKYDGKVWAMGRPHRHHHIIYWIYLETDKSLGENIQGFLDHNGHFLTRVEALIVARECNQLREDRPIWGDEAYSENFW